MEQVRNTTEQASTKTSKKATKQTDTKPKARGRQQPHPYKQLLRGAKIDVDLKPSEEEQQEIKEKLLVAEKDEPTTTTTNIINIDEDNEEALIQ